MGFLKWVFFTCLFCASLAFQSHALQDCDPNDLLALKEFAANLKGGSITSAWSNGSVCCLWDGVICGNGSNGSLATAKKVTKLVLPCRGLKGTISGSLGRLDALRLLNLSWNHLGNRLPPELSNLKHLEVLDLSFNKLVGSVSGALHGLSSIRSMNVSSNLLNGSALDLGAYPNLLEFNISNNSFAGPLGPRLCGSSKGIRILDLSVNNFVGGLEGLENCSTTLQQLHLDYNALSGPLPGSLFAMAFLEQLSISRNQFSGSFTEGLSKLVSLRALTISENHFSGPLPDVFGNLTRLEMLEASSNFFSGPLPTTLSLCSAIRVVNLQNNSLYGRINLNFTGMSRLQTFDLASNHFVGSIPDSISGCPELKILNLGRNSLSGRIPESFGNLGSLSFLSLSNNSLVNLTGALSVFQKCRNLTTLILTKNFHGEEIPMNVSGFEGLKLLALGNCALKGQIPSWLLDCRKLEVLDMSWNHLTGSIPSWIGQMENLFYLDFSNNSLMGEIPKALTELKSLISTTRNFSDLATSIGVPLFVKRNQSANPLQYNQASSFPPSILLSYNKINGTIWPEIGNLKEVHVLDLSSNNISGWIPSSISDMGNLEVLDLSFNNLSGCIPSSFKSLTFLSRFSVAYNNLEGPVPTGGQFLSFPYSSYEGNPGLCPLANSCKVDDTVGMHPDFKRRSDKRVGRGFVLGITIGVSVGIALILTVVFLKMSRWNAEYPIEDLNEEACRSRGENPGPSKLVLFQNTDCKHLTVGDLMKSTNSFNQANIIGCGGFGLVYKAILPNGMKAAVKRLSGDCGQMEREFQAEVEALSRAQHKNLVSLQGYCRHGKDRLLIYSYMENGSLDYWLHERVEEEPFLEWYTRLKIAQGAAHGLAYLHKVCEPNIVHRDVKSSNILLDHAFEAHLADFGLSRLLRPYDTHVTTDLVGTLGYIPPEYSQTLTATFKGDVYSFGVVLLELLTARRPVEVCKGKSCRDLVSWVFQMTSEQREEEIIDSSIWDKDHEKGLLEVLCIACRCLDPDPRRRPSIDVVVSWLDGVGGEGSS